MSTVGSRSPSTHVPETSLFDPPYSVVGDLIKSRKYKFELVVRQTLHRVLELGRRRGRYVVSESLIQSRGIMYGRSEGRDKKYIE